MLIRMCVGHFRIVDFSFVKNRVSGVNCFVVVAIELKMRISKCNKCYVNY